MAKDEFEEDSDDNFEDEDLDVKPHKEFLLRILSDMIVDEENKKIIK